MYFSWVEINLNHLKHNIQTIKKNIAKNTLLLLPLKANAYGHGLESIAKVAQVYGVDWLGLATFREALELKSYLPDSRILVLGPCDIDDIKSLAYKNITPIVTDLDQAIKFNQIAAIHNLILTVHIKLDTGMGRIGFDTEHNFDDIFEVFKLKNLYVEGLMSHFSTADENHSLHAIGQLDRFKRVLQELKNRGLEVPIKHIANSGAFMNIANSDYNMVRPGLLIYGYYPSVNGNIRKNIDTKPLITWKTHVTFIKEVFPGQTIGYGAQYIVPKHSKMATIEIGYGDGYHRILADKAQVLINGQRYPVVGRISMDQTTIDIGLVNEIKVGDEVVLLGQQGAECISVTELAKHMDTIPYEVLTSISARVQRQYMFNGAQVFNFVFSNFSLMADTILK